MIPLLANPFSVAACEPAPIEPWFVETLQIWSSDDVPPGIRFTEQNKGKILGLYNPTEIALYILGPGTNYSDREIPSTPFELPRGFIALYHLELAKVFFWKSYYDSTSESMQWDWDTINYPDPETLKISVDDNQLTANRTPILPIEPINRVEDNRPETVDNPEPQIVLLTLIYGDELMEIPIEISYSLNPDYIPNGVELASKACRDIYTIYPLILIIVVVGIAGLFLTLGFGIIYPLYRKQKSTLKRHSE